MLQISRDIPKFYPIRYTHKQIDLTTELMLFLIELDTETTFRCNLSCLHSGNATTHNQHSWMLTQACLSQPICHPAPPFCHPERSEGSLWRSTLIIEVLSSSDGREQQFVSS